MSKLDARKSGSFKVGGEIEIHRLGFGAMRITGKGIWGPPEDKPEAIRTLKRLPALGIDFVDTADSYGPDVSEQLIREALHPYRGILIATKAGFQRPGPSVWEMDGRPEWLRKQALKSCKQLGVEQIGLWQLHRIDPKVWPNVNWLAYSFETARLAQVALRGDDQPRRGRASRRGQRESHVEPGSRHTLSCMKRSSSYGSTTLTSPPRAGHGLVEQDVCPTGGAGVAEADVERIDACLRISAAIAGSRSAGIAGRFGRDGRSCGRKTPTTAAAAASGPADPRRR